MARGPMASTKAPQCIAGSRRLAYRWLQFSLVLLVGAASLGCSGSGVYPVEGQVTWKDGRPAGDIAGSLIFFESAEKKTTSRGSIQADGSFKLTTNKENDGAPAGEHTVLLIEVGRKSLGGPDATAIAPSKIDTR